ncbi:hypothetical protein KAU51_04685 [Candidatus Parcubacteria bacterium]|nr:hypothetical protein [Candidatus Parcubacteria bacterium]
MKGEHMNPFENQKHENYHPPTQDIGFPDFNTRWSPQFNEGIKTKTGKILEKGADILKKASNFYMYGLGLIALLIFLPAILRFLYEFSSWVFDAAGKIFP